MSKAILKCDFCHRDQRNVPLLLYGPYGSDICSECVEDAVETIAKRRAKHGTRDEGPSRR